MSLIIGEHVKIAAARNAALRGVSGMVVLESMHTLTIRTAARKVTLPKEGSALELAGGRILIGDDLEGRLEDRIAAVREPGRRGGRLSR